MIDQLLSPENKNKIAIVVVGYNRIGSMTRLLNSIENANYSHGDIPLVISIDCSGDQELYDYVYKFEWGHGNKYVNIQQERLGLKKHILQCGDLTKFFKAIILLEDDIFVSEYFYQYVEKAVDYYYNEPRIGGISLYQNEMRNDLPCIFMNDGSSTYLRQEAASWGECWTDVQWAGFKAWYEQFDESRFATLDIPEFYKKYKKAWSKYYVAYLVETNHFFVFPHISHTTCFGDEGEHSTFSSNIGQTNLLCGVPNYYFKPFDEMVCYDSNCTNLAVYSWLGMTREELCVDFYCNKNNIRKCRYLLTPAKLSFNCVRSFGLKMRPYELNVKFNIEGKELFLYDTVNGDASAASASIPDTMANYYLRGYNLKSAAKYVFHNYMTKIKRRLGFIK